MPGPTQKQIDSAVQRDSYSTAGAAGASGENRRVTAVIALNAADFDAWCKANGKNARDRNLLMATPATARGLKDAHLEVTPRGMWRADIHNLMLALVPLLDKPSRTKAEAMGWGQPVPNA